VNRLKAIRFDDQIELGVSVGTDPEMTPRTPLVGVAYARALPGLYTYLESVPVGRSYNVVGGTDNAAFPNIVGATISGGGGLYMGFFYSNVVMDHFGTVGGGFDNLAALLGTVGGGRSNTAGGSYSSVGGGDGNIALGAFSTVPGGRKNRADGEYGFAAGYKARAKHDGTFVWNDRSITTGNDSLLSTNTNQFILRAVNGVGINQAPVSHGIHLKQQNDTPSGGIRLERSDNSDHWDTFIDSPPNDYNFAFADTLVSWIENLDGTYHVWSDARLKKDVEPYHDVLADVLQLQPATYRRNTAPSTSPKSPGFLAQEVEPLFPELVSEKNGFKALNYSGFGVVAIKAIQELHALVEAQQKEIETLKRLMNDE
jgi:hypothetical protein